MDQFLRNMISTRNIYVCVLVEGKLWNWVFYEMKYEVILVLMENGKFL